MDKHLEGSEDFGQRIGGKSLTDRLKDEVEELKAELAAAREENKKLIDIVKGLKKLETCRIFETAGTEDKEGREDE